AAILAEPGERVGIGIRMTGNVFANCAIRVLGEAIEGFGVGARMLADEAEKIEIGFGRLLYELLEHFGLGIGTADEAGVFVPGGVDVIEFAGAGVDEFLERAALLLHASDGELGAFERVEDTEQVLTFAEDDLRSTADSALLFFLVLHQVGTSHS